MGNLRMYYTIEGKKLLGILYFAGLLAGTLALNAAVRTHLLYPADLLSGIDYLESFGYQEGGGFFSWLLLVRLRQLLLFFICLLLFSPYVVFCLIDFAASFLTGFFVALLAARYGWTGMGKAAAFLLPHGLCYAAMLALIYVYLFRSAPHMRLYRGAREWIDRKGIVAFLALFLFAAGCYAEIFLSPLLVQRAF